MARVSVLLILWTSLWVFLSTCVGQVRAMRPDRVAKLRRETVEMFYHGFDNYMSIAFPEDEVGLSVVESLQAGQIAH
jgi:hypothetical protein